MLKLFNNQLCQNTSSVSRNQIMAPSFLLQNSYIFIIFLLIADQKLTSFQRQLNLYGFRRIMKGEDQGAYMHPMFLQGHEELLQKVRREPAPGDQSPEHTEPGTGMMNLSPRSHSPFQFPSSSSFGDIALQRESHRAKEELKERSEEKQPQMSSLSLRLGYKRDGTHGTVIIPSKKSKVGASGSTRAMKVSSELTTLPVAPVSVSLGTTDNESCGIKRTFSGLSVSSLDDWSTMLSGVAEFESDVSDGTDILFDGLFDVFE
jgi:hypothetical protein